MQKPEVLEQHRWLQRLVGEWTFEHDAPAAEGQAATKHTGIERVRMLGEVWAICESEVSMPDGQSARNIMSLGYDAEKQQFIGTFLSSMMTFAWIYTGGSLDENRRALTLLTDGPSFTEPGATTRYRDVIEWISDDERVMTSSAEQADGSWVEFMRATYRRR